MIPPAATPPQAGAKPKFLVIMLGGMEEFVLSTGAFKALREKQKDVHLTLLTTFQFVELAKTSGYFDEVVADPLILPLSQPLRYYKFIQALKHANFRGVYDLQCTRRTEWYFRAWGRNKPDWNGSLVWCSHPYRVNRLLTHVQDWQEEQLKRVGIPSTYPPHLDWVNADVSQFPLPKRYALVYPGGKPYNFVTKDERQEKVGLPPMWEKERFIPVLRWLYSLDITPVLVGAPDEVLMAKELAELCADVKLVNLVGKLGIAQITRISRDALIILGNDNEAVWLGAVQKRPTVLIIPALAPFRNRQPRGPHVRLIVLEDLSTLPAKEVIRVASELLALDTPAESAKPSVPTDGIVPQREKELAGVTGSSDGSAY